jgi:hypothetical protein
MPGQSERVLRARAAADSVRGCVQRHRSGATLRSQATFALPRREESFHVFTFHVFTFHVFTFHVFTSSRLHVSRLHVFTSSRFTSSRLPIRGNSKRRANKKGVSLRLIEPFGTLRRWKSVQVSGQPNYRRHRGRDTLPRRQIRPFLVGSLNHRLPNPCRTRNG